jgi:hypothetical protein
VSGDPGKTERMCAFCGSGQNLTREHVWPRWVQDLVGPEPAPNVAAREDEITRVWTASPATLTVRLVCRACNNGWMARLEHAAKPILTPLISGERAVLSVEDQRLLAYWAAKTVAVGDLAVSHHDPALPAELLHALRTAPGPWPSTVTLAARYEGRRFPVRIGRFVRTHDLRVGNAPPQPWRSFLASVSVGQLVLQVWGHGMINVTDLRPRNWKARYATVIWPDPRRMVWPPALTLTDDGVEAFMRAL